jgi:hypothetical protein
MTGKRHGACFAVCYAPHHAIRCQYDFHAIGGTRPQYYGPPRVIAYTAYILPKQQVLSFDHRNVGTSMLCNLVSNRAAAGQPLSLLQLPTDILHDEAHASSLNWLYHDGT